MTEENNKTIESEETKAASVDGPETESVIDKVEPEKTENVTNNFCSNCGSELEADAKFCKNCGNPVDGKNSTSKIASIDKEQLQKTAKNYWNWLISSLKRPITSTTEEMTTNNMWITFAVIFALLSLSFSILFGSFAFFFIFAIFGVGVTMLLTWLYGILSNAIMKSNFKFFDVFKIGLQAYIYFVPISVLVFIFSLFAKLATIGTGGYGTMSSANVLFSLGGFGFLIYLLIIFALTVGGGMFIMGMYREIIKIEDNKIDRYPWFTLAFFGIMLVVLFLLMVIFGAIVAGILFNNAPNHMGY